VHPHHTLRVTVHSMHLLGAANVISDGVAAATPCLPVPMQHHCCFCRDCIAEGWSSSHVLSHFRRLLLPLRLPPPPLAPPLPPFLVVVTWHSFSPLLMHIRKHRLPHACLQRLLSSRQRRAGRGTWPDIVRPVRSGCAAVRVVFGVFVCCVCERLCVCVCCVLACGAEHV
jgi:hypothetical protein